LIGTGIPASRPRCATGFSIRLISVGARAIEAKGRQRVDLAIHFTNARLQRIQQVVRGQITLSSALQPAHSRFA
jgi:hypothetical protein